MKPHDEESDLKLVAAYLAERGLSVGRFKQETLTGKTPDFRVRKETEPLSLIAR